MLAAATGMSSQVANTRSGAAPSSLSITSAASDGAIGAASACSAARACCASSGSPSAMKLTIWPTFISTPFICPSSLATSAAVRMANWASSSARRSAGVIIRLARVVAKRPALRAVSFHIRRVRQLVTAVILRRSRAAAAAPAPTPPVTITARLVRFIRSGRSVGSRPTGGRVGFEQLVADRLAGDLIGPVGAVLEPFESVLDSGQVLGELVE